MRLDKFLSKALVFTRSEVSVLINKKRIKVNNVIVNKKDYNVDENNDIVLFDDTHVIYNEFKYIMLNKPPGVVSSTKDNHDTTVIDLIDQGQDLFPIGRLDKDTTGLLILTNDGKVVHNLTSPNHNIIKKYYVEVKRDLREIDIDLFSQGLAILDGNDDLYVTKSSILEPINKRSAYVYISEGKFHQIKRMFIKVNNEVTVLKRIKMGDIELDSTLKEGQYRNLTEEEIKKIK